MDRYPGLQPGLGKPRAFGPENHQPSTINQRRTTDNRQPTSNLKCQQQPATHLRHRISGPKGHTIA
ncbi:MAG TPA: hypothetical protein DDZ51_01465 [Planctomycetaceae bacterium]|nr:hypothetical protein [Planctomycetaceae bacterium]